MDFCKRGLVGERVSELRTLLMLRDYSKAIRLGLTMYNDRDFENLEEENKYIITYNLALAYRKNDMNEESLSFLKISKQYVLNNNQGLCRILWLANECEISLNIDVKEKIEYRYNTCVKYYKSINSRLMIAYVLYNLAKYNKRIDSMYRAFLMMLKETKVIIPIYEEYSKSENLLNVLSDMKQIDINLYNRAKGCLNDKLDNYVNI